MRRAAKRDGNECEIVTALRGAGYAVERLSAPGLPDLLVAKAGRMHLLEIKAKGGSLTAAQRSWMQHWPAAVWVVTSPEEALEAVSVLARRLEKFDGVELVDNTGGT